MIWEKYFYREIRKTFCFLLFCFYGLYVILDLMAHIKDLREGHTSFFTWIVYYLCTFSRRLDVLIPFTVLIGTIRILLNFQSHNMFVALLAGGLSMQTLLRPFLVAACSASLLLYINYEFILPKAQPWAIFIQENNFGKKLFAETESTLREVRLQDTSKMIFRSYNSTTQSFQDVFWVASLDTIYHMKTLNCREAIPKGKMVDVIKRDKNGFLQKEGSYQERAFPDMHFDDESLKNSITHPRDQSISQLFSQMQLIGTTRSDRSAEVTGNFFFKLSYPLIAVLACIACTPFCMRFTRNTPHFMIYMLAISGLFCFILLLQVVFVLAKGQVVPAWLAFGLPLSLAFFGFGKKFGKQS